MIDIPADLDYFADNGILNKVLPYLSNNSKFIFVGPSGVGKTFLAKCLAKKLNMNFTSIDAYLMNFENTDDVLKSFSRTLISTNLTGTRNLLHVSNADRLFDYSPIIFLRSKDLPGIIIFETNSDFPFFSKNKRYIEGYNVVRFYKLTFFQLRKILANLEKLNNVYLPESIRTKIINNSHGNAFSLINDFKSFLITKSYVFEERNSEDSLFESIRNLLSGKELNYFLSSPDEIKNFLIWLNEEVPLNMKGDALKLAFEVISYSDILLRRIQLQNWFLLKYVNSLINSIATIMPSPNPKLNYKINYSLYLTNY